MAIFIIELNIAIATKYIKRYLPTLRRADSSLMRSQEQLKIKEGGLKAICCKDS